jgi:hypothetical protein
MPLTPAALNNNPEPKPMTPQTTYSVSSSAQQGSQDVHAPAPSRFVVITSTGDRSSISMPPSVVAEFMRAFGTRQAFRDALDAASKSVEPSAGQSRSLKVRMAIAALLKNRAPVSL